MSSLSFGGPGGGEGGGEVIASAGLKAIDVADLLIDGVGLLDDDGDLELDLTLVGDVLFVPTTLPRREKVACFDGAWSVAMAAQRRRTSSIFPELPIFCDSRLRATARFCSSITFLS